MPPKTEVDITLTPVNVQKHDASKKNENAAHASNGGNKKRRRNRNKNKNINNNNNSGGGNNSSKGPNQNHSAGGASVRRVGVNAADARAGADVLAAFLTPDTAGADHRPIGVLGETEPVACVGLAQEQDMPSSQWGAGGPAPNSAFVEIRADPLNAIIYGATLPNSSCVSRCYYPSFDYNTGLVSVDYAIEAYAESEAPLCSAVDYLNGPAGFDGNAYYPLMDGGRAYVWVNGGSTISVAVVTDANINGGDFCSISTEVYRHTGTTAMSWGTFIETSVVPELRLNSDGVDLHRRIGAHGPARCGYSSLQEAYESIGHVVKHTSVSGGRQMLKPKANTVKKMYVQPGAGPVSMTNIITIFTAGYYSFSSKYLVQSSNGLIKASETGQPYSCTMSTLVEQAAGYHVVHQPMVNINTMMNDFISVSVLGVSALFMNKSPVIIEGGKCANYLTPQHSNWCKVLFGSFAGNSPFLTGATWNPYELLVALSSKSAFITDLKKGSFIVKKPNLEELALTKYWDISADIAMPSATYSQMLCPSKSLLICWTEPAPGLGEQKLTLRASHSIQYTTLNRFMSRSDNYVSWKLLEYILSQFSNPNIKFQSENPSHVKLIFAEIMAFIRGMSGVLAESRSVVRGAKSLVSDVMF